MKHNLEAILQDQFWLETFRDGQKEVIENTIAGKNTLVFMPTGWGKSLTYQLPGLILEGLTIVISPLISLMKDQVDALTHKGIKARLINSTLDASEVTAVLEELKNPSSNPVKFLYIAPERLNSPRFTAAAKTMNISLVVIDEAHCISQWGHDFRPSYMKIKTFLDSLEITQKNIPVSALTATATQKVRVDIVERLGLQEFESFITGFDRKNITIVVREISQKTEKMEKVLEILDKTPWSGIIYCSSRKAVKEVYDMLLEYKIKAGMYMGNLPPEQREAMQDKFMNNDYKVMVATNAFGMGIDKKDIRFVIHYNLPGSIENYYQEVGRAGRDGKQSFWVVLASYGDTKIQEFFIDNTYPEKSEIFEIYDYLYKDFKSWEWVDNTISKTYKELAAHTSIETDMKVGNIIKILEKYNIVRRGWWDEVEGFRGRWITLIKNKRPHAHVMVDWARQQALKDEWYFKLEQIKRLLFYPSCRKRFILNYFGDKEDLATLWDNCAACDFCLDRKKFAWTDVKKLIPHSSYALILETVKKYSEKFGAKIIGWVLVWSEEKKILEWHLDDYEHYSSLSDLDKKAVAAMIDALIFENYLYKSSWAYPMMGITELGLAVLYRDGPLKDSLAELNTFVMWKVGTSVVKSSKKWSSRVSRSTWSSADTYKATLALFKEKKTIAEIVELRDMWLQTIEWHVVKLYESWDITLLDILNLVNLDEVKIVKTAIKDALFWATEALKPIKEYLEQAWDKKISYFTIKIAIAMMWKGDL